MPGAGKSTLGQELAPVLGSPFMDLDHLIEFREKKTITEIFSMHGETFFREAEKNALYHIIQEKKHLLLACGGGTPCFHKNMDLMNKSGTTLYLKVSLGELIARTRDQSHRPLLNTDSLEQRMESLLSQRERFYLMAHHVIENTADINAILALIK